MLATMPACRHKQLKQDLSVLEERVVLLESAVRNQGKQIGQLETVAAQKSEAAVIAAITAPAANQPLDPASPDPAQVPQEQPITEAAPEPGSVVAKTEPLAATTSEKPVEAPASTGNTAPEKLEPVTANATITPPEAMPVAKAPATSAPLSTAEQAELKSAPAPSNQPTDLAELYKQALQAYFDGKAAEARQGFGAFLEKGADDKLAPNAAYWLAEVTYRESAYEAAQQQFAKIVERYPKSGKAADALLKVGKCQEQLGKVDEALESYRKVIALYPGSAAAELAKSWF